MTNCEPENTFWSFHRGLRSLSDIVEGAAQGYPPYAHFSLWISSVWLFAWPALTHTFPPKSWSLEWKMVSQWWNLRICEQDFCRFPLINPTRKFTSFIGNPVLLVNLLIFIVNTTFQKVQRKIRDYPKIHHFSSFSSKLIIFAQNDELSRTAPPKFSEAVQVRISTAWATVSTLQRATSHSDRPQRPVSRPVRAACIPSFEFSRTFRLETSLLASGKSHPSHSLSKVQLSKCSRDQHPNSKSYNFIYKIKH